MYLAQIVWHTSAIARRGDVSDVKLSGQERVLRVPDKPAHGQGGLDSGRVVRGEGGGVVLSLATVANVHWTGKIRNTIQSV